MPKGRLVGAAIPAAVAVALAQSWGRWLDPVVDVGRDLYIPEQLRLGARLYADIRYNYPPLAPYLLAGITALTGSSLAAYAWIGVLVGALAAALLYAMARLAAGPLAAGSAALLFVACCFCCRSLFNFVMPFSQAATIGMLFFVAFGAFLYRFLYLPTSPAAAIICALAASWCRIELAAAVIVIVIVAAVVHRAHALWLYFVGLAVTAAAAWLIFGPPLLANVFPSALLGGASAQRFYRHVSGFDDWLPGIGDSAAAALGVAAMAALIAILQRVWNRRFVAAAVVAALALATWLLAGNAFFRAWSVLQIVLLAFALRRPREPLLLLVLFALGASARIYLNLSPSGYGAIFILPTLVLIAYTLFEWLPSLGAYSRAWAICWLPLVVLISIRALLFQRQYWSEREFPVATARGTFYDANPDRARILAELLPHIADARSLVVMPEGIGLNYLARVPTTLTFHTFTPPETAPAEVEALVVAEMERRPPEYVALVTRGVAEFGYRGLGVDYDLRLKELLDRQYTVDRAWHERRFELTLLHRRRDRIGEGMFDMRPIKLPSVTPYAENLATPKSFTYHAPGSSPNMASTLDLMDLAKERPRLTVARGVGFAEAAAVCLETNQHRPGVIMPVDGTAQDEFEVRWQSVEEAARSSWADLQEATEHGAYGVALLLVERLLGLTVVERSFKHTGFDYWLAPLASGGFLFQNRTKLEVSGIAEGESTIAERIRRKQAQVAKFDPNGTVPAYVAVIDFRHPAASLVKR